MVCKLPFKGVTRERVLVALAHKGFKKKGEYEHELRVVYELLQGNKLHKERLKVTEGGFVCVWRRLAIVTNRWGSLGIGEQSLPGVVDLFPA